MSQKEKHFGKFLKTLRAERGVTQRQLADAAGVAIASISGQENKAVAHLASDKMVKIVDFLDTHAPLPEAALQRLQHSSKLPVGYSVNRAPVQGSGDHVQRLLLANRGKLRVVLDDVHEQIKQEAGAKG